MPDSLPEKHKCGPCGNLFDTEAEYLGHTCEKSGVAPTEIEHLEATTTPNARAISDAALDRGDANKEGEGT